MARVTLSAFYPQSYLSGVRKNRLWHIECARKRKRDALARRKAENAETLEWARENRETISRMVESMKIR